MNRLNITNGDSGVGALERDGIAGRHLEWKDVLHDGPVPAGLNLGDRAVIRCRFLSEWVPDLDFETAYRDFEERNRLISAAAGFDEIVLWFEHDLYDQLQILEVLAYFAARTTDLPDLWLVNVDEYLGCTRHQDLNRFWVDRVAIGPLHLQLAQLGWNAFTAPSPVPLAELLDHDTRELPFLRASILRLLEEYPHPGNGLSGTEQRIAECLIKAGELAPGRLFGAYCELEDPRFMGDLSFFNYLDALGADPEPLIETAGDRVCPGFHDTPFKTYLDQRLRLSRLGREVAARRVNWMSRRRYRRTIGGVTMDNQDYWTFDPGSRCLQHHLDGPVGQLTGGTKGNGTC